jgi:hypothetical protein
MSRLGLAAQARFPAYPTERPPVEPAPEPPPEPELPSFPKLRQMYNDLVPIARSYGIPAELKKPNDFFNKGERAAHHRPPPGRDQGSEGCFPQPAPVTQEPREHP